MKKSMLFAVCAALLVLTACGALAEGNPVLPSPEDLESVTVTASELDLTSSDADFIARLLESLEQSVKDNTGRASVQDVPGEEPDLIRIDFGFREGGASTLFLYQKEEGLFLEQPYQGIYELDASLEPLLRQQLALELERQYSAGQE